MKNVGEQGAWKLGWGHQFRECEEAFLLCSWQVRKKVQTSLDHITGASMFLSHEAKIIKSNRYQDWSSTRRRWITGVDLVVAGPPYRSQEPWRAISQERERCITGNWLLKRSQNWNRQQESRGIKKTQEEKKENKRATKRITKNRATEFFGQRSVTQSMGGGLGSFAGTKSDLVFF